MCVCKKNNLQAPATVGGSCPTPHCEEACDESDDGIAYCGFKPITEGEDLADSACLCSDGDKPVPENGSCTASTGQEEGKVVPDEYDYDYDEVDHCTPNPCENDGSCADNADASGHICRCTDGYEGDNCETTKKEKTTVGTIILITVVVIIILAGAIALGYHIWTKPEQKKDSKDVEEQGIEMDDLPLGKD
eukprot:109063_1